MRLAVIPARGGSKRVPMKNIIPFHGRPIIAWSIEAALKSGCFDEVIVSTDSEEIAKVAREHGAGVPFVRPPELSDDHTGTVPVIAHATEWFRSRGKPIEEVCCICATAPLIEPLEIREGLRLLLAHRCDYVFSATTFSHPIQRAIRVDDSLRVSMFYPEYEGRRSQDLEPAWHDAAQFYWGQAQSWLEKRKLFQSSSRVLPVPRSRVHDVDTAQDVERLEMLFAATTADRRRTQQAAEPSTVEDTGASRRLSLGTVQFGMPYGVANEHGQVTKSEAADLIRRSESAGIRSLDTASAYGASEEVLGAIGVAGWEVTTKLSAVPNSEPDVATWIRSQLHASLRRLQLDRVHAVLLHRPEQVLGPRGPELVDALNQIKQEGLVAKVGVSVYSPGELEPLFAKARFDIVQAPFSILDRRLAETGSAARLKEMGVELHARSIFLQGLLLVSDAQRPRKFDRWSTIWRTWAQWLGRNDLDASEACLLHALSIPEIDRVVVGVDEMAHLESVLATRMRPLPGLPEWPQRPPEELLDPSRWNAL